LSKKLQIFIASSYALVHYGHNMPGENKNDGLVYFGPKYLNYVPLTAINELPQVRAKYDQDSLNELATSIVVDASVEGHAEDVTSAAFDLIKPITVGRHDRASARRYINDHAEYYRIARKDRVSVSDMVPMDDNSRIISIAGHRRKRAIQLLLGRFEIGPEDAMVAADERWNVSFAQAQGLQLRENVYDRPPAQDEARAIDLFYRDIVRRTGKAPLIAQFASQLGFSETKVRDALAFASLPESIQAFTYDNLLPYSTIRRVKVLSDAFERFYRGVEPTIAKKHVEDDLITFCNQMVNMDLSGNTEQRRARLIENKAKEIFGQADYQQEGLFFLPSASPEARRQTSSSQLASLAINVLKHQIKSGEIPVDRLDELQAAIIAATDLAKSQVTLFADLNDLRNTS